MKNEVEIEVRPGGKMRMIYQDGVEEFAKEIGAEITSVRRLSNVEWEEINGYKGWTVRAAHDSELALRYVIKGGQMTYHASKEGDIVIFVFREAALAAESDAVWDLLPKEKADGNEANDR